MNCNQLPFTPEHAETARLTEMALRSAIVGVVTTLLARIESSVEAAVWRGLHAGDCIQQHSLAGDGMPPPSSDVTDTVIKKKKSAKKRTSLTGLDRSGTIKKKPRKQAPAASHASSEEEETRVALEAVLESQGMGFADGCSQQLFPDM